MATKKYNHAFWFLAEVMSDDVNAEDLTPEMLADALRATLDRIMKENPKDMLELCEVADTIECEA